MAGAVVHPQHVLPYNRAGSHAMVGQCGAGPSRGFTCGGLRPHGAVPGRGNELGCEVRDAWEQVRPCDQLWGVLHELMQHHRRICPHAHV